AAYQPTTTTTGSASRDVTRNTTVNNYGDLANQQKWYQNQMTNHSAQTQQWRSTASSMHENPFVRSDAYRPTGAEQTAARNDFANNRASGGRQGFRGRRGR